MRRHRLRYEQQTTRVLVQSVNDPGTRQFFQLRHMMQQAVHEGSTRVSGARVHDEAGLFVDHQYCVVFENDIELNRLRFRTYDRLRNCIQLDEFATVDLVLRTQYRPVDDDRTVEQPGLQAAARILRKHPGQCLV